MAKKESENKAAKKVMAEILSNITLGKIGIQKEAIQPLVLADQKHSISVAMMYWIANAATDEQSKLKSGEESTYSQFKGQFRARNNLTGKMYRGGKMILPRIVEGEVAGALANPEVDGVEFGFEITARYDKESGTSYVFGAIPFKEADVDPLAALEAVLPPLAITA
jgi:hypothetical protein